MSELIYNKEVVDTYKTNFKTEKDDFSNVAYDTFNNSYLNTSGETLVSQMASSLKQNYSDIENGYSNISSYWNDYTYADQTLESSLESFTASCSNDSVNAYLNSFIGEITDYSSNNDLDTIVKLVDYTDIINEKIDAYSEKYDISTETYAALIITNGSSINSEEDIDLILDNNSEDIVKYTESLKEKGFPDDYASKLTTIHIYHPNWEFEATSVGTTLEDAVDNEISDYTKNTTQLSSEADGTGRQPESGWYTASKESVTYYMDPTNSLNEKGIFQFQKLSYSETSVSDINTALSGTFMENKTFEYNGKTYTYAETFNEVGKNNDVNSIYLTSRVLQEQGKNGSATAEMTGSDGKTYYNYFNFNAYGSTQDEVIQNGLSYAEEHGLDSQYKSINDGGTNISNNYIKNGQDTIYYQKYNVTGDDKYEHQYMANISAPTSESEKTYNVYKNCDLLDSNFVFDIPVYD